MEENYQLFLMSLEAEGQGKHPFFKKGSLFITMCDPGQVSAFPL